MSQQRGMTIVDETRRAVMPEQTVADLCTRAVENMVTHQSDYEDIMVLWKGSIYYFRVLCTGVRPPYPMCDPDEPMQCYGQRPN